MPSADAYAGRWRTPHRACCWLDDPARPAVSEPLPGPTKADLVVVGGGYTGLWTALRARSGTPSRDVVLLEAGECGWQASRPQRRLRCGVA